MIKEKEELTWYTLRVQSNLEKSILDKMSRDRERGEVFWTEAIIPVEKVQIQKKDVKYLREKPLYPGYIFLQTDRVGDFEAWVKTTPGASYLLRDSNGNPQKMPKEQVDQIYKKLEEESVPNYDKFNTQERVSIISGPFSGFQGVVKNIISEKNSVKVAVTIFGKETLIELTLDDIQKIEP